MSEVRQYPGSQVEEREGKYLTFSLSEEEYGIAILKVKEIIGIMPVTPVPKIPHHVKGVINLRGKVIPVVDLRLKFGMPEAEYTEHTCIIVVEISQGQGFEQMGIVVDSVSEVRSIDQTEVFNLASWYHANTGLLLASEWSRERTVDTDSAGGPTETGMLVTESCELVFTTLDLSG